MGIIAQLAVILVAVAVMSLVSERLRISAIPLFMVAGVILGPFEPFPAVIELGEPLYLLAELGVILLLFYLGLEFSLERILQARKLVLTGGVIDLIVNGGLGLLLGFALLGVSAEAVLLAGIIYVSSSGIITQALFDFRRLADDETDMVLGTLVFEDLAIALFLGLASGLAVGTAVSGADLTLRAVIVVVFVAAFLAASHFLPRYIDRISPYIERERLVLVALAIVLGASALAGWVGLSAPVGALLAGILLSETEARDRIERHLFGLRDFTAAIFFFVFGLQIDLGSLGMVWEWLILAAVVAIGGKLISGWISGRMVGFTRRQSFTVGASLIARGEFSLILAQLAALGTALSLEFRDRVVSFAGLLVLVTAAIGVILMRESRTVGRAIFGSRRKVS
ncbi:MAG: cation:proton antiporter [Acidobacteria bacterium]|nr:cation:proton antiporter [Acidobacteriota bacterium]